MVQPTNKPRLPSEPPVDIGKAIKLARTALGWSQAKVAQKCGWTHSTISRIERGDRRVELNDLWTLVHVLEISPERFGLAAPRIPHPRGLRGTTTTDAPKVPAQLPMTQPGFVGRRTELASLDQWFHSAANCPGVGLVVVTGMAGVGKSTLARRWAHQVKSNFPDGNLHVDLRGFDTTMLALDPSEVLAQFLQSIGATANASPITMEGRAALYRSHVANRRLLVFLDNAANSEQVRPLLPGSSGSLVIVTSRDNLANLVIHEGAHPLSLDPLPFEDARELLARRVGDERVAREPDAVGDLVDACARLPLTVSTVASRARLRPQFSLRSLATELLESKSQLDTLDSLDGEEPVRAILTCSYSPLPEEVKRVFRLLALHPGPDFTVEAAASVAGISRPTARRLLVHLTGANLLQEPSMLRFSYHDLLRQLAGELLETHEDLSTRTAATRRLFDHYLRSAYAASTAMAYQTGTRTLEPPEPDVRPEEFNGQESAHSWFQRESDVLLEIIKLSAVSRHESYSWKIARYVDSHLDLSGNYFALETAWRTASSAAERAGDLVAQSTCRHRIGHALTGLGHPIEALHELQQAVEIRRSLGDASGEATVLLSVIDILDDQGNIDEAVECAGRANALAEAGDDAVLSGKLRNAYAWILARCGELDRALVVVDSALEVHRGLGDTFSIGNALDTRAYARYMQGRYTEAVDDFNAAITIWQGVSALLQHAKSSERLAHALMAGGDIEGARTSAEAALDRYRRIEDRETSRSKTLLDFLGKLPPPEQ